MKESQEFDWEWMELIKEARDLGVSKDDVRIFLRSGMVKEELIETVEILNVD